MGIIARSTKAGSTTSFATSASLGNVQQVADLDNDLDAVYSEINGDLTDDNIADNAITSAKIANSAVTEAKIASDAVETSKLADDAVTTPKILDQAITNTKIALTTIQTTRLAVGASIVQQELGNASTWPLFFMADGEKVLGSSPLITTRGGSVLVLGTISLTARKVLTGQGILRFKLYRNLTVIAIWDLVMGSGATGIIDVAIPFPVLWLDMMPAASIAYAYSLTCTLLDTNWQILATSPNQGAIAVVEFA